MPNYQAKKTSGFTLTEIIITIIIIGVLASVALPRFTGAFERVRASEGVQILTALLGAQKARAMETGAYTTVLLDLDIEIDRSSNFGTPPVITLFAPDPYDLSVDVVAEIDRTNSYTLGINEEGAIRCTDGAGSPDFTCAQAGYP